MESATFYWLVQEPDWIARVLTKTVKLHRSIDRLLHSDADPTVYPHFLLQNLRGGRAFPQGSHNPWEHIHRLDLSMHVWSNIHVYPHQSLVEAVKSWTL